MPSISLTITGSSVQTTYMYHCIQGTYIKCELNESKSLILTKNDISIVLLYDFFRLFCFKTQRTSDGGNGNHSV